MEMSYEIWPRDAVVLALQSCNNDVDRALDLLYNDLGLSSGVSDDVGVNQGLLVQSVLEMSDGNLLNNDQGSSSGVSDEVGVNLGQLVQSVMEMSYGVWPRDVVVLALQSCNNDVDRALDLLYNDQGLSSGVSDDVGVNQGLLVQSVLEMSDGNLLNNAPPTPTSDFKALAIETTEPPSSDSMAPTESDIFEDKMQTVLVAGSGKWDRDTVFWALIDADQITERTIAQLSSATESTAPPPPSDLNAPATESDLFEQKLQSVLEIGFGKWDRDNVFRALNAADTTEGAIDLLSSDRWTADSTDDLNPNKLRGQRVVVSSLPISLQHRPEPMLEKVSFKGKIEKLEGPSSPFPMIDVSTSLPATELPQPSSSRVSDKVAGKLKLEAASSERSLPKLQKLKREFTFVADVEKIAETFFEREENEEAEDSEHAEVPDHADEDE